MQRPVEDGLSDHRFGLAAGRSCDAAADYDAESVYDGHEARRLAAKSLVESNELDPDQFACSMNPMWSHDRLLRFSNLISSIEESYGHMASLVEERDARANGCRNYTIDLVAMLCTAPTRSKEESTIKVRYLDRLRTDFLDRHTRMYLMLNATIEHEIECWSAESTLDRGLYPRH